MSIGKSFLMEKLIGVCVKVPPPLEEQVMTKLAIQLCQHSELKKCVFYLPEANFTYFSFAERLKELEESFKKQSAVVCKTLQLSHILEAKLMFHIWLIKWQLFYWSRQLEIMFDISPDFTSQFVTSTDWTAEGTLNERKIAERLVSDERIPVHQRYRIACVYCLEYFIFSLWNEISSQHRSDFCASDDPHDLQQPELIKLWSYYLAGKVDRLIGHDGLFWQYAFERAVKDGERRSVVHCWEVMSENTKQEVVVPAALDAIRCWRKSKCSHVIEYSDKWLAPAAHYTDIFCFLLSQLSMEQRIALFRQLFSKNESVLECFLEWPYQDILIPIVSELWEYTSEFIYLDLLLALAYCVRKGDLYYNYLDLLKEFLRQTPNPVKHYIIFKNELSLEYAKAILSIVMIENKDFEFINFCISLGILEDATF